MAHSHDDPTAKDRRRYYASKAGRSSEEIAKDEGVEPSTVEGSITRVRTEYQKFTTEEAGIAVRKALFDILPVVKRTVLGAMDATQLVEQKVIERDPETGATVQLQESVEVPDHYVRLKGVDAFRQVLAVVQPKDPAIVVNANTQNNILNQAAPSVAGQLTSPEAVIRAIRAERGYALTDGKAESVPVEEVDEEDESGEDDPDDDDGEYAEEED